MNTDKNDLVTVQHANPAPAGERIPSAPSFDADTLCTAPRCMEYPVGGTERCGAHQIEGGTLKPDAERVLEMLAAAPSCQLTTRAIARKLGRKPSEIVQLLVDLRREGLIERPYTHEAPTARAYRLIKGAITAVTLHTAAVKIGVTAFGNDKSRGERKYLLCTLGVDIRNPEVFRRLIDLNRQGRIRMARVDLPAAVIASLESRGHDPNLLHRSEMCDGISTWHALVL